MGRLRGPYEAEFPVGSAVRAADRPRLEEFRRQWSLHNPLQPEQLEHAGRTAVVRAVGYYHGGYQLYSLDGIPSVWHEVCLSATAADRREG